MIIIYICTYLIGLFTLYLIMNDLKKFKLKLYNEIDYKIWIKVYVFISILFIHIIWLMYVLFINYNDNSIIYGVPIYLLFLYIIFVIIEVKKQKECNKMSNTSEKINKYINYIFIFYFICILIIILIPNYIKLHIIECISKTINKYM